MKKLFVLIVLIGFSIVCNSQERWTVALNSKLLLTATTEDTMKNRIVVSDLKKGSLFVTYVPGKVENERKRRIMIFDATDQELYSKEAHNISVPVASIKKWRYNTPFIQVYTIPVLGAEGANVRLRRVHLATIQLQ